MKGLLILDKKQLKRIIENCKSIGDETEFILTIQKDCGYFRLKELIKVE